MRFRKEHIAGAQWDIRPRLTALLASIAHDMRPLVLISDEAGVAACAALELQAMGLSASRLEGDPTVWRAADGSPGRDVQSTLRPSPQHYGLQI
ncbi:hypothetical protein BH11PSE7_BH11PSE7_28570 [soil metagenome]